MVTFAMVRRKDVGKVWLWDTDHVAIFHIGLTWATSLN